MVEDALKQIEGRGVSRIPIYVGERENTTGYVLAQELTAARQSDRAKTALKTLLKPIAFVRDTTNCLSLLTGFLKHRRHITIVTDESDGVDGRVTLEDLPETLPGTEIVDETDRVVDWQQAARAGRTRPSSGTDSAQKRRKQ